MFFLNLSLGEFLGLLSVLSGLITALYLLDRAKKKKIVSTLRFWADAGRVDEQRRRKHVREPWSLVLQLVSLALLLLAIAQVQWGNRERQGRDHVVLLDCSSWMGQRTGKDTLLDKAKQAARKYISALPAHDRVMLVRVDALSTPITRFTDDRKDLMRAIDGSKPSYSALDLQQAFETASHSLRRIAPRTGDIVYIGSEHVASRDDLGAIAKAVRVLPVQGPAENVGIRRIGVRRPEDQPELWQAYVAVRNYGLSAKAVTLGVRFADSRFAPRRITLAPGEERSLEYRFSTTSAGTLAAELQPGDNLPIDDHAELQLPKPDLLRVAVYTTRPEILRPLVDANRRIKATYLAPSQYNPKPNADVVLLDGIDPPISPQLPSLWITPPAQNSPVDVMTIQPDAVLIRWHNDNALGAGLHSRELKLSSAEIFSTTGTDIPVASAERGAIIVGRPATRSKPRLAVIGFDPLNGSMRFELSTPIVFANLLHWLAPESFRATDFTASAVGAVTVPLDGNEPANAVQVVDSAGFAVPFTVRDGMLQLYVDHPSTLRVLSGGRESVLSLTLPEVPVFTWKPPTAAQQGMPPVSALSPSPLDLWKWLAVLGGLGLLAEWLFFGKQRRGFTFRGRSTKSVAYEAEKRELVTK